MSNTRYNKQAFYWGMTQDERMWWDLGFIYSENIDPISNTWYFELSKKPVKSFFTGTASAQEITHLLLVFDDIVAFTEFNIYSSNIWDTTSLWGLPWWTKKDYKQVWTFWDYVYWTYVDSTWSPTVINLFRFLKSDIQAWSITITAPYTWFTWTLPDFDNTVDYYLQEQIWTSIYLTIWEIIYELDYWTNTINTFDIFKDTITWLNYAWWHFKVITEWGLLMLWDWYSQSISEVISLWQSTFWSTQIADTDYVFTWTTWSTIWSQLPTLNLLNWYQLQKMFSISESDVIWEKRFRIKYIGQQSLTTIKNFVIMIDRDDSTNDRIAVFWNNINWFPRAYFLINTKSSDWTSFNGIKSLLWVWNKLYIAYNNANHWVDIIDFWLFNTASYEASGHLITNLEDMWDKIVRKGQNTLISKVSWVDATHTVKIDKNIDLWWFTNITTINSQPEHWISKQSTVWDFREIALKYTLTSWDWTTSPRVYWLNLDYENQGV